MKPTEITQKDLLAIFGLYELAKGMGIEAGLVNAIELDQDKRISLLKSLHSVQKFIEITDKNFKETQLPLLEVKIYSDLRDDLIKFESYFILIDSHITDHVAADKIIKMQEWRIILHNFIRKISTTS